MYAPYACVCVVLWTCKVLCGSFYVPHTHFHSFIHSFNHNQFNQSVHPGKPIDQPIHQPFNQPVSWVCQLQSIAQHLNQTNHSGANKALRPIQSRNQSWISKTFSQSATVNCLIISISHTIWGKYRLQNLKISLINLLVLFRQNQHTKGLISSW